MLSKKTSGVVAIAGMTVVALLASAPAAISGSPSSSQSHAEYEPVQSISYEFGSKAMSGYFVQEDSACLVMLMIAEKGDPETALPPSPTRVRLALNPGQIAGLDSEEGSLAECHLRHRCRHADRRYRRYAETDRPPGHEAAAGSRRAQLGRGRSSRSPPPAGCNSRRRRFNCDGPFSS